MPLLAVENVEDTVKVDRFFIGQTREVFALRVKGESMIEDGIFDGDYIFVRKQLQASRGDIVVAMINDEATVKRYYPEGDSIRFQPANARDAADHRAQARLQDASTSSAWWSASTARCAPEGRARAQSKNSV